MTNSAGPKPQQEIDAIIFDHDGTLVDSESITLAVVGEIAVDAGAEIFPEDIDRFVGADLHVVFAEIERRSGAPLPEDIFDRFRARQTTAIESGLDEVAGAHALLSALSLPMAVASNAPVAKMELCLRATNLLSFFAPGHLVSAYDVNLWKPDPAVFLRAAEVLGVDPSRCAVVEDSQPGVEAGLAAGMTVFALDPKDRFANIDGITRVPDLGALGPFLNA